MPRTLPTRRADPPPHATPRGTAVVEFLLVALPLFLLGVGVIEVTRWAVARQAVTYALFEAARMGAITDADPAAVRLAFERGLVPLLGKGKTDLADGHAAVRQQLDAFYARWGVDGYRLVRVPPDRRAGGRHDDDTILLLDLTYLHAPLFPGIRQVLRHGVPASGADAYTNAARQAGLVVIRRDMAMPMQAQTMRHRWKSDGGSGTMPR